MDNSSTITEISFRMNFPLFQNLLLSFGMYFQMFIKFILSLEEATAFGAFVWINFGM